MVGMRSGLRLVKRLVHRCALCGLVILGLWSPHAIAQISPAAGSAPASTAVASPEHDALVDAAFEHFYNLDYDRAIQEFEKALDRHPTDPSAVNHLLSTILMRELYRMGAMNSGEDAIVRFIGEAHAHP